MRIFLTCLAIPVSLLVVLACTDTKNIAAEDIVTPDVPAEYRALYGELAGKLIGLDKALKAQTDGKRADTRFGVELLVANSNRGEALLTDRVFNATILTLDRLQDLGVRSVAVSIQFPLLTRSFPRFIEYKDFYRRVTWEIRRRGFGFIIEIGTFFHEAEFTKLKIKYDHLTLNTFNAQLKEMADIIIEDLRPDYLTILTEPDTMKNNTGLNFTVTNFSATIRHVVEGLNHRGVNLGAGAGTWNQLDYFKALAEIPQLKYIDMHIYPIQRDYVLDNVLQIAQIAAKHNKGVSIGEAWLYKVSKHELEKISPVNAFARDVFSFWQPLDSSFIEIVVGLAHQVDAEFCSFFWMKHLYAYMEYDSRMKYLRPQQLINKMDVIAGQHIFNNNLSKTGETFKSLITAR